MLHEFQFKAVAAPTDEGHALLACQKRNFEGLGHDDLFYTAIAELASHFGITADDLVAEL